MLNSRLRVLIVDDSAFFRRRIEAMLKNAPDIEVAGHAVNGKEAVQKAHQLKPDLITMDVRMPGMDGISAVYRIMAASPTRILMLSALTKEGARETLDALEAGAVDFLPKEQHALAAGKGGNDFATMFLERVRTVGRSRLSFRQLLAGGASYPEPKQPLRASYQTLSNRSKIVPIGASTGGPVAVQAILSSLPGDFDLPLLVAVHMPASFTSAYAERLNIVSAIEVREAVDREPLRPGCALIAPGGKQMTVECETSRPVVKVMEPLPGDVYHSSVDRLFHSLAEVFNNQTLGLVLTGMGSDGLKGASHIKQSGGHIWSQAEGSCVVYGMPHAVERAGLCDRVLPINAIGQQHVKLI